MSQRRRKLKERRPTDTVDYVHNHKFTFKVSFGRFESGGGLAEVFVNPVKTGTELDAIMHDASIAISRALQHGDTLDDLRAGMKRNGAGEASSPIGGILDHIAKELQ
jgi:hypothetical protein